LLPHGVITKLWRCVTVAIAKLKQSSARCLVFRNLVKMK